MVFKDEKGKFKIRFGIIKTKYGFKVKGLRSIHKTLNEALRQRQGMSKND